MTKKLKLVIFITILFIAVCSIFSFTFLKSDKLYSDSSTIMNKQKEDIVKIEKDTTNEDQEFEESKVVEVKQEKKEVETTPNSKSTNSKEVSNTTTSKNSDSVVTTPKTETTTNNSPSANNNNNTPDETNTTQSTTNNNSYIGVPNPNDFYYSYHKGNIDYKVSDYPNQDVMQICINDAIEISLKDTVDILNTNCIDVMDGAGNLLGEFLYIKCSSGNCNRYKN